jgi:acetyl-CoA acetyltransferase family protein
MQQLGHTDPLGITAENLAEEYGISREEQDRFAVHSQRKAVAAAERLAAGIVPVEVRVKRSTATVDADEGPRPNASLEGLAKLRPAFKSDGTVTDGNSSSLNDGAAVVLLTSRACAQSNGLPVLATVRSIATAGVPPRTIGIGPVPATEKALRRLGMSLDDVDLIELNEAFAAQALAVLRDCDVDPEDDRLNVPEARYALATTCIGVGQGIAMVLEAEEPTALGARSAR